MDRRTVIGTFCASMLGSGITALVVWDTVPPSHDALAWFGLVATAVGVGGLGYLLITGPRPAPRHRDGIYQFGERVGGVAGAKERIADNVIEFAMLTATENFDQEASFEYRSYVLEVANHRGFTRSPGGGGGRYNDVKARILRKA